MNKFICLLLSAIVVTSTAGCASDSSAQRSRAEKAQSELGAEISKQKVEKPGY